MLKHIAYIIHRFPRLTATFISSEMAHLKRMGYEVTVLSLYRCWDDITQPHVLDSGLVEDTVYYWQFPEEPYTEAKELYPVIAGETDRLKPAARALKERGVQLLHGAFGNRPAEFALALAAEMKIPFTFELHAFDLYVDFPEAQRKAELASAVRVECEYAKRYLIEEMSLPSEKLRVIPLSPNSTKLLEFPAGNEKQLRIVSACRLHPIKGLDTAIRAFKRIHNEFPGLTYDIIGDGEEQEALESLIDELDLSSFVRLLGPLAEDKLFEHVRDSRIFLLPSRITEDKDRDGTPTAIIEAMYLGTPVVTSFVSGIPEMIQHRETGYLCEPNAIHSFSGALRELLKDDLFSRKIAENAKLHVKEKFNINRNVASLIDVWEQTLRER